LHWENVINFHWLKMADISKVGLLLGREIRHITATQAEVKKFLLAYVILFNALIFGNILSACAKEYLIAARY